MSADQRTLKIKSGRLFNAAGADATRADITTADFPVLLVANTLQIGHPAVTRSIVGVADAVTVLRTLAADFTLPAHIVRPPNHCIDRRANIPSGAWLSKEIPLKRKQHRDGHHLGQ